MRVVTGVWVAQEVRPTSPFSARVAVGRTSYDSLRLGTRHAVSRLIRSFSAAFLVALLAAPAAHAQADDPAAVVDAFSAAFNSHDLNAALALFDTNGSATDIRGQHFDGRPGLAQFLLASGFGTPGARITTNQLQVFGNRAIWSYSCSCAADVMNVRVVLNHNKIIVFFVTRPNAADASASSAAWAPSAALWPALLALLAAIVLTVRGMRRKQPPPPRPAQGRLLAGLKTFRKA